MDATDFTDSTDLTDPAEYSAKAVKSVESVESVRSVWSVAPSRTKKAAGGGARAHPGPCPESWPGISCPALSYLNGGTTIIGIFLLTL